MEFGILGPLLVQAPAGEIRVPGAKQRALLAALLLAHRDDVVPAERLIDELWGDEPPPTAAKSLQVHVSQLRHLLGEGHPIVTRPAGYAVEMAPDALDLERFERGRDAARRLQAAGDLNGASAALAAALELFRGPPLADVKLRGPAATEPARLEALRLAALEDRLELDLARGEHAATIAELEVLVAEHPYRERLHAHLMLALYRAGRRADALEAYRRACAILAEDLGLDPGPQLQRLEAAVLAQDPALEAAASPPRMPPARAALPAPASALVGRSAELDTVAALLFDPDVRLVTIAGPGGVGKTQLALEVAHRVATAFRDGARFTPLAAIDSRERLENELAQAVNDDSAELLLVLDNFEQLVGAADAVTDLLSRAPAVTALVTSQSALRVRGEREVVLAPLDVEPAVELFVRRAHDVDPIDPAIPKICQRLDGLPLAIELAAARTRLLTPTGILDRLGRRMDLLTGGSRDAPARQRTLRAAIEWSHDLLDTPEQRVFAHLAVFAGGWSLEAAEAVTGNVLGEIESLVERSLVVRTGERLRMLETVREFARERFAEAGDADVIAARHAAWARDFAEAAETGLEGSDQATWLRRLDAERENLAAAAEWAVAAGDAETAQRLCGALWRFWLARGAVAEGRRLLRAALAAGAASPAAAAPALNAAGILAGAAGDHAAAREAFDAALDLARAAGDRAREARVMGNLGVLDVFGEEYTAAQARYEAAAEIWRELGDLRGLSVIAQNLAIVHEGRGDLAAAQPLLEESVALARAAGQPTHIASTLHVLGSLLARSGEDERALPFVRESLELSREAGENVLTIECLETLAGVAARRGDPVTGATLRPVVNAIAATLGTALRPDALAVAYERGRRLTLDDAAALGSSVVRSRS